MIPCTRCDGQGFTVPEAERFPSLVDAKFKGKKILEMDRFELLCVIAWLIDSPGFLLSPTVLPPLPEATQQPPRAEREGGEE